MQTFTGKHTRWPRLIEVIGLAATGPPPQEVPQSDDQDGDTGNTTNHTTNDWANGS